MAPLTLVSLLLVTLAWGPIPTGAELNLGSHTVMREADFGFGSEAPTFYAETMMLHSGEHNGIVWLFQIDQRAYLIW